MPPTGFTLFNSKFADLRSAKQEWSRRLFSAPRVSAFRAFAAAASLAPEQNVVGVGVGEQIVNGKPTGIMAVKFFVRVKYPESELTSQTMLPRTIAGLPVDVEESGLFRRLDVSLPNPKTRLQPAQPGCSVGFQDPQNQSLMAGTFGALVKDGANLCILSNNHVLADEGRLPLGAPIFQPGLLDGGDAQKDQIAVLTRFLALQSGSNTVDGAIATLTNAALATNEILHIGPPAATADAAMDMVVHKFGRTSSYTVGTIKSVDTDVAVGYETGNYTFQEQIIIVGADNQPFSAAGDSGSLVLQRSTNQVVGLLCAGSPTHTIANHIGEVLQALNVQLA